MNTKMLYLFDPLTAEYLGTYEAQESPQEPGSYIEPIHSTDSAPPAVLAGQVAVFNSGTWLIDEDHRGATVYDQTTGTALEVSAIGPVPIGYGLILPASTLLAQVQTAKIAEIELASEAAIAPITSAYPIAERDTWPIQEAEAVAWTADPQVSTPMLDAIATARGQTVADVAANVLTKAAAFKSLAGTTFGKRKAKIEQVMAVEVVGGDVAAAIAAVEAVTW